MNDEQRDEKRGTENDSSVPGKAAITLLGILFLPAVLLAVFMYFGLLRKGRQKFSVVLALTVLINIVSIIIWRASDALAKVIGVIQNIRSIDVYWTDLIPAAVSINLTLGSIIGALLILWQIRKLKDENNDHLRELKGSWMYQFKFRRTPYEYYRRQKMIKGLKEGKYQSNDKVPLGIDDEDNIIYRYNTEMPQSTIIAGAVGSGKTVTELGSIHSDIVNGISLVIIDFKNSAEFSSKTAKWAADNNRDFYHFVKGSPDTYSIPHSPGQAFYDPLKNGGSSRPDMLLGMREYDTSAAVYKQGMRELLQTLFMIMGKTDKRKTKNIKWNEGEIYKLHSIINGLNGGVLGNLSELIDATDGTEVEATARDLEVRVKTRTHTLNNAFLQLQGQIKTLVHSEYGRWLKNSSDGRNIDLFKLLKNPGNVVLFSIDGDREKDFAKYLGSLILADLSAVSSMRRAHDIKDHVNVYIDEFQAVSPTALTPLLEKSRQAGFGVTMASQSFEQIISAAENNGEAQLRSILDTCANFIIHAGSTETSAERLAGIIGKKDTTVYRQANQNQNFFFSLNWKNRRNQMLHTSVEEKWIVPPSFFMNLSIPKPSNNRKSTAVIIKKSSDDPSLAKKGIEGTVVRKVWMIPDQRVLEDYYTPTEEYDDSSDDIGTADVPEISEVESFTPEERHFDEPIAPLDYISQHHKVENDVIKYSSDELDSFDEDDDTDEDGGFEFEILDDDDTKITESIDPKFLSNASPKRPKVENTGTLPSTKKTAVKGGLPVPSGLPQKSPARRSTQAESSYSMFANQEDFKPSKRVKERPPIVEDDIDLDSDSLPDL